MAESRLLTTVRQLRLESSIPHTQVETNNHTYARKSVQGLLMKRPPDSPIYHVVVMCCYISVSKLVLL